MKKLIALFLMIAFLFAMAACASDEEPDDVSSDADFGLETTQATADSGRQSGSTGNDSLSNVIPDDAEGNLPSDETSDDTDPPSGETSSISNDANADENPSSAQNIEDEYIQYLSEEPDRLAEFLFDEGELDDFVAVNSKSRTQAIEEAATTFARDEDAHHRALERAKDIISRTPEALLNSLPNLNITKDDAIRIKDQYIQRLSEDYGRLAEFLLERDELRDFVEYGSESRSQIIEKATKTFEENEDIRQEALERAREIIAKIPITRSDLESEAYELRDRYSQIFQRMKDSFEKPDQLLYQ